jgi:hypothetical protein
LLEALAAGRDNREAIHPARQSVVISIGTAPEIAALVQEIGLPPAIPLLVDTEEQTLSVWGVASTPTTVIIDENQRFVRHLLGFTPKTTQSKELAVNT